MIFKEFCAENMTNLPALNSQKVTRVELCDNLTVGGTTPSYGVIKEAAKLLHEKNISLATLIRPRGGSFVYNDFELKIMEEDILQAVALESDSLVLGLLTEENEVDAAAIDQLLPATQGLPLVFHMAFDHIPRNKQKEALDQLVDLGFVRILLHGSVQKNDILENASWIKELRSYADGRIEIMPGGGVRADNYQEVCRLTGCQAVHGTHII
ncbi:copper homeostasis protein CutC [Streptococcus pantholopis]|uniref:PF03932 family protein CutC n=1 Tax=Streptococcus pantholopis TaxID=1811193 RepID=A0A172Q5U4_9STRE|nr:copper homeostasis protein CutC [Streptococcus pantholopis]AND78851.1 copper homeostasis protein CutC [Streptococcus pantholopis]